LPISGFGYPDPDGNTIQILRGLPDLPDRLSHTACPTTDVQRQWRFYRDVLGLRMTSRLISCAIPNPWDRGGKPGGFETTILRSRGDGLFSLDVLQWSAENPSFGTPYEAANNLGYAQVVFEVDDIAESYEILRRLEKGRKRPDFRLAGPPETWDLGPEVGTRKVAILYDWMGVRYQLVEAPEFPTASDTSLPAPVCPTL
jgi:catechol 2,3-dioxygenase-like lactoylglutathione lyase family enzyme